MKILLTSLALIGTVCAGAEGFERYRSVIDRQPFGPPPPGFDPSVPANQAAGGGAAGEEGRTEAELTAEEQKLMASVRVSVLNVNPAGYVMVGFTDSTAQPPLNYYLKKGETSTDAAKWTVKDADPAAGEVTLSKDGIDVTLRVGDSSGGKGGGKSAAGRGVAAARPSETAPGSRMRHGSPRMPDRAESSATSGGSLARLKERRAQRQALEQAAIREKEKEAAAAAAKAEQEKAAREEERAAAAAEREQQRDTLLQIQEELRRAREARNAAQAQEAGRAPEE